VVIRPLAYVPEREIDRYARAREFPIIPCKLCGSQDNLQRVAVKRMLAEWERELLQGQAAPGPDSAVVVDTPAEAPAVEVPTDAPVAAQPAVDA
jgi:tRNA(Ile)-lysidine synthase TilS/MesJ